MAWIKAQVTFKPITVMLHLPDSPPYNESWVLEQIRETVGVELSRAGRNGSAYPYAACSPITFTMELEREQI